MFRRVILRRRVFSVRPNKLARQKLSRSQKHQSRSKSPSTKASFTKQVVRRSNSRNLQYSHRSPPSIVIRHSSSSPMFPKTHIRNRSVSRNHSSLSQTLPVEYEINSEIASLANHLVRGKRAHLLPPIKIPQTTGSVEWPTNIPTFVISINPKRQQHFMDRFLHKCTPFQGTNGKTINESQWRRENRLISYDLKRGEIGCYDSHLRLWEMLVKNEIPMALICEDDVNLSGNQQQSQYFNTLLSEVKQTTFDVRYSL